MEVTNDLPALPPSVFARDLNGDAAVYTPDMLRDCILADRAARVVHAGQALATAPTGDEKDARLGRYVKQFATKGGWTPDDGEGAFEFVQRHSYVVGIEDAGGTVGPYGTQTNGSRWPVSAFVNAAESTSPTVSTLSVENETYRGKLLALAEECGARITGKPNGSEPVEVVFPIPAWRRFDIATAAPASLPASPELTVWEGPMPESNGKSNFTAVLMRKDSMWDGPHVTIERSEYPDRIRYEADRVRHLIGEIDDEPDIFVYDADKHSGYVARVNESPAAVANALRWKWMESKGFDLSFHADNPCRSLLTSFAYQGAKEGFVAWVRQQVDAAIEEKSANNQQVDL